eukprot:TRINITY_DN7080_c3_g1_i1.p1 TRINITY_DN7080_c3_g1~~TRINITY_DN7080_c3_g1_i1.p1  ORF type:complete len:449 (+),score=72.99 TRINITY_DN7080_c3_g1_i1:36-1349(+)
MDTHNLQTESSMGCCGCCTAAVTVDLCVNGPPPLLEFANSRRLGSRCSLLTDDPQWCDDEDWHNDAELRNSLATLVTPYLTPVSNGSPYNVPGARRLSAASDCTIGSESMGTCTPNILGRILDAMADDRLMEAGRLLRFAELRLPASTLTSGEWMHQERRLAELRGKVTRARRLRRLLCTDNGWHELRHLRGIRTLYKPGDGTVHTVRIEGDVESPAFYFFALLREMDLYTQWVPSLLGLGLATAPVLRAVPSRSELLADVRVSMPWPFSNRRQAMSVDAVDCMKQSSQIIALLGDAQDVEDNADDDVRMSMGGSGVVLTPKGGRTFVQILLNIDFKLVLPGWLQDGAFRNLAFLLLERMRAAALKVPTSPEYHRRYAHPDSAFYKWIRERIAMYMPEEEIPPVDPALAGTPLEGADAVYVRTCCGDSELHTPCDSD